MPWQFRVVEGADQGRVEVLPDAGIATIGSSRRHADIHLNDLYVARVHGEVETDGNRVVLTAHDSPAGTLVNGQKILQQEIRHGDVVRMGNSHLRLEDVEIAATEAPPEEDVPELDIEVLAEDSAEPVGAEPASPEPGSPAQAGPAVAMADVAARGEGAAGRAQPLPGERLKELVGHPLAHFHVEDVIAMGHSGVVFEARDLKKDQRVALKVLATDFPNTDAEMKRYVEVWKAVMPLRHPHIVTLLGVGKTGPFCWLAMERVEGTPLVEIIERLAGKESIDWRRGHRVAVQIGRALAFAHENGIVHSNISARHILWRKSDKTAKLTDLGLASALEGSNLKKITLRDKLQSDLIYFSPEQTEPANYIDGVCDIYSLGIVVYALLTGQFPYTGASQAETIRKIREGQLARPREFQGDIPDRLNAIVVKMLARRQEDRYQTAEELLADLQIVGDEEDAAV
ncbi:MAG: protein kinase [Gemmataceae bacterium]|nr:protein kinase [Gemmataceae bacterium]